jgi:allophanate hydrolase subunit 2
MIGQQKLSVSFRKQRRSLQTKSTERIFSKQWKINVTDDRMEVIFDEKHKSYIQKPEKLNHWKNLS